MGNLPELLMCLVMASGLGAAPTEDRSTVDWSAPATPGNGESIPPVALSGGSAQPWTRLLPGDRVRFSTAEDWPLSEANVVATDEETMLANLPGVNVPVPVRWSSLRQIELYRGQQSLAGRGARIGALSFGIPWAALSYYGWAWANNECFSNCPGRAALAGVVVLGVGAGAGVGALIGSFVKTERWDRVDLPPIRVSLAPQRGGGLAVAFSLRF